MKTEKGRDSRWTCGAALVCLGARICKDAFGAVAGVELCCRRSADLEGAVKDGLGCEAGAGGHVAAVHGGGRPGDWPSCC